MSSIEREFREDRILRDAAKRLVKADLNFIRGDVKARGVGQRALDRAGEGARDIAEEASDYAEEHPVKVGTGLAVGVTAVVAYIFRDRIFDALDGLMETAGLDARISPEPERNSLRSRIEQHIFGE